MNNEIDFQYVSKQDCLKSIITTHLQNGFKNHRVALNDQCIHELCDVVVNVLKAVAKEQNKENEQYHIIKNFKQDSISQTDIELVIQYDLYRQLERLNQNKNLNYNILKEIGGSLMNSFKDLTPETINNHNQPTKYKA